MVRKPTKRAPRAPSPNSKHRFNAVSAVQALDANLSFLQQLRPDVSDLLLEGVERARVLEDEVRTGALELCRHLRRDHVHRLGLAQTPIANESLEAERARGIDENDTVEARRHVLLEQERYVADHDAIAPLACLVEEPLAKTLDLGMDDLVQLLELLRVAEYRASKCRSVELTVRSDDRCTPAFDDLVVSWSAELDGAPRKDIGVDNRRATLREELCDSRFATANVSCETDDQHLLSPRHTVIHTTRAPR